MEESSHALVIGEHFLKFKRLFVPAPTCLDLLSWWQYHENQFLAFLVC